MISYSGELQIIEAVIYMTIQLSGLSAISSAIAEILTYFSYWRKIGSVAEQAGVTVTLALCIGYTTRWRSVMTGYTQPRAAVV